MNPEKLYSTFNGIRNFQIMMFIVIILILLHLTISDFSTNLAFIWGYLAGSFLFRGVTWLSTKNKE